MVNKLLVLIIGNMLTGIFRYFKKIVTVNNEQNIFFKCSFFIASLSLLNRVTRFLAFPMSPLFGY